MDYQAPKTFAEYYERHPEYHLAWLARKHPRLLFTPDYEDAAQYLLLETLRRNRVEKYNPDRRRKRGQKDTPGLFLHFMSTCFQRDMRTLYAAKQSRKRRANEVTISIQEIGGLVSGGDRADGNEEGVANWSQDYALRTEREGEMILVSAQFAQFRAFIAKHRPDLLDSLDNIDGASQEHRTSLARLAGLMAEGTKPGKKRKDYVMRRGRKAKCSPEQVADCAAQGMTTREAAAILGYHEAYVGELARKYFSTNWKGLVRQQAVLAMEEDT